MPMPYSEEIVEKLRDLFDNDIIQVDSVTSEATQTRNDVGIASDWVQIECGSTEVESTTFSLGIYIKEQIIMVNVPKDVSMDDAMTDIVSAIADAGVPTDEDELIRIVQGIRDRNRAIIESEQSIALAFDGQEARIAPRLVDGVVTGFNIFQDDVLVGVLAANGSELRLHPGGDMDAPYIPLRK